MMAARKGAPWRDASVFLPARNSGGSDSDSTHSESGPTRIRARTLARFRNWPFSHCIQSHKDKMAVSENEEMAISENGTTMTIFGPFSEMAILQSCMFSHKGVM